MKLKPDSYIAIEGSIGVGKSTLAKILASELEAELIQEDPAANPFLGDFYRDPGRWAFQVQLTFLLQRHRQLMEIRQISLFHQQVVTDYLFDKDRIFAALNLQERDYNLYLTMADALASDVPTPDLVVYLQAPIERLLTNIRIRDIPSERQITAEYLMGVAEAYNRFFIDWDKSPLLIVNASRIDIVKNESQRTRLLEIIRDHPPGTTYFNPEA